MFQETQEKENRAGLQANGIDRYGDMERALEQQAQLIGRFEAEENAQREWEEKYRENNFTVVCIHLLPLLRSFCKFYVDVVDCLIVRS